MKRISFLFIIMWFSLMIFAEGPDFQDGNLYYKLVDNKECYVYGLVNEGPQKLIVPSTAKIGGRTFPVTGILGWPTSTMMMFPGVKEIILPNSVTFVGSNAFWSNTLESVQMDGVEEIGFRAFYMCHNLKKVSLKKIKYIGDNAFEGCKSLQKLVIPSSCLEVGANVIPTNSGDEFTLIIEDSDKPLIFCSDFYGCHGKRIYIGRNLNCAQYWVNKMRSEKYGTMYLEDLYYFKEVDFGDKVTLMPSIYKKRSRYKSYEEFKHLTIGSSVVEVPDFSDEDNDIQSIHMVSMTPPAVNGKFNSRTYIYCKLYVPKGSLTAYKNAPIWKEFFNIEEYESERTRLIAQLEAKRQAEAEKRQAIEEEERRIEQERTLRESQTIRGSVGENLNWELYNGTLTLLGNGKMIIEDPIKSWQLHQILIKSVIISNGITNIGDYAFEGYSSLTSVTIPNSVTSIGKSAFSGCSSLTSISIPNSVTSIGSYAFSGCSGLTSISIPNSVTSIGIAAFFSCAGLKSPAYNAHIFAYMPTFYSGDYVVPDGIKSIAGGAFNGCAGLTSITIPNSATSIGSYAFSGCSGLTSISIPNSVTSIGKSAFSGCSGLTSISIPNSVTSIEENAFANCTGLASVTIPNSVTSIGKSAFSRCSGLTSISIPNSVTSIEENAFANCTGLASATIPNSVTSIEENAFKYCRNLTITLPKKFRKTRTGEKLKECCKKVKYY